jgi:hypothetical protein
MNYKTFASRAARTRKTPVPEKHFIMRLAIAILLFASMTDAALAAVGGCTCIILH